MLNFWVKKPVSLSVLRALSTIFPYFKKIYWTRVSNLVIPAKGKAEEKIKIKFIDNKHISKIIQRTFLRFGDYVFLNDLPIRPGIKDMPSLIWSWITSKVLRKVLVLVFTTISFGMWIWFGTEPEMLFVPWKISIVVSVTLITLLFIFMQLFDSY